MHNVLFSFQPAINISQFCLFEFKFWMIFPLKINRCTPTDIGSSCDLLAVFSRTHLAIKNLQDKNRWSKMCLAKQIIKINFLMFFKMCPQKIQKFNAKFRLYTHELLNETKWKKRELIYWINICQNFFSLIFICLVVFCLVSDYSNILKSLSLISTQALSTKHPEFNKNNDKLNNNKSVILNTLKLANGTIRPVMNHNNYSTMKPTLSIAHPPGPSSTKIHKTDAPMLNLVFDSYVKHRHHDFR